MPYASVAMAVRNEEAFLEEAISSVLTQTYGDFELLILDDASMDRSAEIIRTFAGKDARVVPLANERHLGLTKCLNRLLHEARGEIIIRMDGNDVSLPSRFERQLSKLEDESLDMVWCNAEYIDERGATICERRQVPLEETMACLPRPNHVVHAGALYRRSTVLELGGYDERYASGQDGDLWRRMRDAGCRFGVIHEPLLQVRILRNSVTGNRLGYPEDMNAIYAKTCIINGDRDRAKSYLRDVASPVQRVLLALRMILGERTVEFLKEQRGYSYDEVHRRD